MPRPIAPVIRRSESHQIVNHPSGSRPIEFRRIEFRRIEFRRDEDRPCRRHWNERHPTGILLTEMLLTGRPKSAVRSVDRLRWDATNGLHLPMTTNDENAETRP